MRNQCVEQGAGGFELPRVPLARLWTQQPAWGRTHSLLGHPQILVTRAWRSTWVILVSLQDEVQAYDEGIGCSSGESQRRWLVWKFLYELVIMRATEQPWAYTQHRSPRTSLRCWSVLCYLKHTNTLHRHKKYISHSLQQKLMIMGTAGRGPACPFQPLTAQSRVWLSDFCPLASE